MQMEQYSIIVLHDHIQQNTAILHKCNEYFGRVVFSGFLMNLKNKINIFGMGLSWLSKIYYKLTYYKERLNI